MAETTTPAKTTPAKATPRKTTPRAARKPAASKAQTSTPAKAAPAPATATAPEDGVFVFELAYLGETKNFSRFAVPDELKDVCVGSIYAPNGTAKVHVRITAADPETAQ